MSAEPEDEQAARAWILERCKTAGLRDEEAPRISIVDLMMLTGWDRPRALKFAQRVLDETRGQKQPAASPVGISALIAAISDAPEGDEPTAEDLEGIEAAALPSHIVKGGYRSVREYNAAMAARRTAEKRKETWDKGAWLQGYRSRSEGAAA